MLVKPAYMCLVAHVVIIFLTAPPPPPPKKKQNKKKKENSKFWTSKSGPNLLIYDNIRVPPPTPPLRRKLTIVLEKYAPKYSCLSA